MLLSIIAASFGLLALNITGHYALLALGQVRLVSMLNILGGVAMLAVVVAFAPSFGLKGAAVGRLFYGPITLLMYFRLHSLLTPAQASNPRIPSSAAVPEESF